MHKVGLALACFLSLGSSCPKTEDPQPTHESQAPSLSEDKNSRGRRYRVVHDETDCLHRQTEALASGCIDDKGLKAMQVLHAMPMCTAQNEFSHWEACDHKALREIKAILDPAPNCKKETNNSACELVTLTNRPSAGKASSIGERVLILEDGLEHLALTRYASRVLDTLEIDVSGTYHSHPSSYSLPKPMKQILVDVLNDKYPWISPMSLTSVGGIYLDLFEDYVLANRLRHGNPIFTHLAEFNPRAEFVIAAVPLTEGSMSICDAVNDEWRTRYRAFQKNMSDSLIQFIRKYQISYVNMSFGDSLSNLMKRTENRCRGSKTRPMREDLREMLNIMLEEFYLPLSSLENVIVVHAAGRSDTGMESFDVIDQTGTLIPLSERKLSNVSSEHTADCARLPNRLRVASFSVVDAGVGIDGVDFVARVNQIGGFRSLECIDVVLNNGFHDPMDDRWGSEISKKDLIFTMPRSSDSIVSSPEQFGCNSEIAPLAISYLMQIKRMNPNLTTSQLLQHVRRGGKFKDPLRHELHLFNVFGSEEFVKVKNAS